LLYLGFIILTTSLPLLTFVYSGTYPTFNIGYIGEFEIVDDHRSGKIVIQLIGRLNKCGVISPRFNVKQKDIETWINNLLPSRQFGYIVVCPLPFITTICLTTFHSSPPLLVSWTTKKLVARRLVERSWDSSTKYTLAWNIFLFEAYLLSFWTCERTLSLTLIQPERFKLFSGSRDFSLGAGIVQSAIFPFKKWADGRAV
jgi:hypothetical protein